MRPMPLLALLLVLVAVAHPQPAAAAVPCDFPIVRCLTVQVPLEPSRPELGRVGLFVQALRPAGRTRRTVIMLAGGPGQASTTDFAATADPLVGRLLSGGTRVVVFDARGTGRSGLVRCPELQRDPHLRGSRAAEACARRLGDRRGSYGIDEHVDDIEAVRRAIRAERIDLSGTSYGTLMAERYAQAHPERVGRLLLDSVVRPGGSSAQGLEVFAAMPRVLNALCDDDRCLPYTKDPVGQLAALVQTMRQAGPLSGTVVDERGRRRTATIGGVGLLDILFEGDFNPGVREALVPAVIAARRGDTAPLLRLARQVAAAAPPLRTAAFSAGAYAAGSCEVLQQPWDPAADVPERLRQAREAATEIGGQAFFPFDVETAISGDFLSLCLRWPAPLEPVPSVVSDVLPPKPTLVLAGAEDLRTPLEEARKLVEANPAARLLVLPRTGHSVTTSDATGCATRASIAFLLAKRVPRACRGPRRVAPRVPVPPRTAAGLKTPAGVPARIGRTVQAVDLALDDVQLAITIGARRGGGLRGGSYVASGESVRMRGYEYVPGIRIDAEPRFDGSLVIRTSGPNAARGRLVLEPDARVRGVVGGRRIVTRAGGGPPRS
ncbi:MAG: hypothetical protein AVDCRST_MAG85-301 [uncultured Solirubrobacteraceae bacterium]|uniref:prolyl aminopeptidase n=1 Tax=uncultured Solirubrobacteraceae bacterium TaxID=1162706 RepID=A0A6J4RKD0_9ACTN|nr:MAG: hypothetical protein AVDCRST_MAG85-301 [uncultured Solirubrobacteraceae bacterium]